MRHAVWDDVGTRDVGTYVLCTMRLYPFLYHNVSRCSQVIRSPSLSHHHHNIFPKHPAYLPNHTRTSDTGGIQGQNSPRSKTSAPSSSIPSTGA